MTRILDSSPFQMCAVALATFLIVAGFVRVSRKRHPAPHLPADVELECWEWDEFERIETLYGDTADEPARGRRRPS